MAWEKVPASHADAFAKALPSAPGVELRKMFGCPAGFAGGRMFCGAHERNMIVRLAEDARQRLADEGGSPFVPMGRPMKEYMCVPPARVTDVAYLRRWFAAALAFTQSLPAKPAKSSASAAKRRPTTAKKGTSPVRSREKGQRVGATSTRVTRASGPARSTRGRRND